MYQQLTGCSLVLMLFVYLSSAVEIMQTIPMNNSPVCPGQKLQYTCTSSEGSIGWKHSDEYHVFIEENGVLASEKVGSFNTVLSGIQGSVLTSTATNPMISSDSDNTLIECFGGKDGDQVPIDVADKPESCSNVAVIPKCQANNSSQDGSITDVSITLPINTGLMCVEGYQIHFYGQIQTVSASTPSVTFSISNMQIPEMEILDGLIYTLDHESRTGEVPCNFSIPGPTGVNNITHTVHLNESSPHPMVLFSWMPSEIRGCLDSNTLLVYSIHFNVSSFRSDKTTDTSYTLPNVTPGTELEVTITPTLPTLQLSGPSLSTALKIDNHESTVQTTLSATTPSGELSITHSSQSSANVSPIGGDSVGLISLFFVTFALISTHTSLP